MIKIDDELRLRLVSGVVMFAMAVFFIILGGFFYSVAILLLALLCASEFFMIVSEAKLSHEGRKYWVLKGVVFIGVPAVSFIAIRDFLPNGIIASFWLFVMVSMVDTCAYFVGKFLGRHALAPKISPSKTIEGLVGGVLGAVCFSGLFYLLSGVKSHIGIFVAFSICVAILAQIGDLGESYFKRQFGVKDSSSLIPGHGGFLDRLDGYLLAAPFMLIFCFAYKAVSGSTFF